MPLRAVFMGTPEFAVPSLRSIRDAGHDIAAVYTRAPKPAGRGMAPTPTPVERLARAQGIPVETPASLRDPATQQRLRDFAPQVIIVVAYGLLLPQAVLDIPPLGCLNVHASLLPRWRGAAPIQRAIMAGDAETGVMVMRMEAGLDTGPFSLVARLAIGADATAGDLHDPLAALGGTLIEQALEKLETGALAFTPQVSEGVTYAHKIDKAEARIDWTRPASGVHNIVRGLSPFPGAWFERGEGKQRERVKVIRSMLARGSGEPGTVLDNQLTIACGDGAVRLVDVQRAGGKPTDAQAYLRGAPLPPGTRLA